jgi:hypothetical protein
LILTSVPRRDKRIRREIAARRDHARCASSLDPSWRTPALRKWVADHAATDASILLAHGTKRVDLLAIHPMFDAAETKRFMDE